MVNPNEKMASLSETLPLKSNEKMEDFEEPNTSSSCGCFKKLCFGRRAKGEESADSLLAHQQEEARETWFMRNLKKVQHVSELLAGPKRKNFIRRSGPRGVGKKRWTQFHYDLRRFEREESLHPRF